MKQATVTSFIAIHRGNAPAQGMRFEDERDGDGNGRGIQQRMAGPELRVLAALCKIPGGLSQFAAKAPRSGVVMKLKTAIEGLPI